LLFLRHQVETGKQVRVVFEAEDNHALELTGDGVNVGDRILVRPCVLAGIRRAGNFFFHLLGGREKCG
jgi:hypothetical protein